MEAAASMDLNATEKNQELKRLCITFGVTQSNALYRILSANDKAEMQKRIIEETENLELALRGSGKCPVGTVWDEARQECV